jgi:DNA repair protein RadA/Sms
MGRCPECRTWHSFVEETVRKGAEKRKSSSISAPPHPIPLDDIPDASLSRILSGLGEWDRVLGNGLTPGSLVLLAGDPGIGKSTILLQALAELARERRTLYVSGEESYQQLKLRAGRLGISAPNLLVFSETSLDALLDVLERDPVQVLAIDSIQTIHTSNIESAPGSIGQIRECAAKLMRVAKEKNVSTFLVGHVTKEGAIAGPKVLEHLVDTVLYLEGDKSHTFRLLRAVKNRFGATNEIGVFEMKEAGMIEVPNPSQFLLAERPLGVSGSVVACSMEGARPILVELQALVSATGWTPARRTSMGVDSNRVSLILAVLEKRLGFNFARHDVFVNVAGGVRLTEPAADLSVTAALISSYMDRALPSDLVAWGEVGLAGEVRGVGHSALRVSEAQKLGFRKHLIPGTNADKLLEEQGTRCMGVRSIQEILPLLFGKGRA